MELIALKGNFPQTFIDLFNKYKDSTLTASSTYQEYKGFAEEFLQNLNSNTKISLKNLTLSSDIDKMYEYNSQLPSHQLFNIVLGFENLFDILKAVIDGKKDPVKMEFKGFERNLTPSFRAFVWR